MRKYNTPLRNQENETDQERFLREDAYLRAKQRVKKIKGFYSHLAVYLIINTFIIGIIVINGNSFWNIANFSTAFFWGIGLAFHALGVFGKNIIFGKNWEDKKIREYLEKEEKVDKRRFE